MQLAEFWVTLQFSDSVSATEVTWPCNENFSVGRNTKTSSRGCIEGSVRQTPGDTRKYDVWSPAEILSDRKHLLTVNMSKLSVSTDRTISER
jgi:hypothetical protein